MPTKLAPVRTLREDLAALKAFIREKQMNWRPVHRNLEFLEEQYRAYINDFARCGRYRTLRPHGVHARVLNKLYDQSPACLGYVSELRERARETLPVCPYCGLPGRLTLDHYLPKDVRAFPHFSIFSFNLVPACDACQTAKGNLSPVLRLRGIHATRRSGTAAQMRRGRLAATANGRAQARHDRIASRRRPDRILHPYFDEFVKNAVWHFVPSDLKSPFDTLALVAIPAGGNEASLVNYHIRKLGLQIRSLRDIAHLLRFTIQSFRDRDVSNKTEAAIEANYLLRGAFRKTLTPNSVDCTFLRAVRDVPELADDVLQRAQQAEPVLILCSQGVRF